MEKWYHRWLTRPHPVIVGIILIASLVALWRGGTRSSTLIDQETRGTLVSGTVVKVISEKDMATTIVSRTTRVQDLLVRIQTPDKSFRDVVITNDLIPLAPGDSIYINAIGLGTDGESLNIVDVKRISGLVWLAVAFMALVLAVSGKKGINALVGLIFSIAVIFTYLVPAVLAGQDPIIIGLIASAVILVGTFYVSYGFDGKSLSALAGIVVTLVLVVFVGAWVVGALHFTGYADENSVYLNQETSNGIDLVGLVIAGIIVAAIGVLDDVAVTQSSTVYELAKASPARGWKLFQHAMKVGTDHISGVINTLVLAYAGASLPLILLLHLSTFPLSFSLGGETVAEEIVRTLVSSAGLVLAVPLATAVAVLFVDRWGTGISEHGHHH
jgi:uncharacterized membrane protein